MAEIDTLLKKLSEMNADCADLRADEQVEVVAAGTIKKGAHVSADTLRAFLGEVVPFGRGQELDKQLPFEFTYESPHGTYEFSISWSARRLQAVIEPARPAPNHAPSEVGNESSNNRTPTSDVALPRNSVFLLQALLLGSIVVLLGIGCLFYWNQ